MAVDRYFILKSEYHHPVVFQNGITSLSTTVTGLRQEDQKPGYDGYPTFGQLSNGEACRQINTSLANHSLGQGGKRSGGPTIGFIYFLVSGKVFPD